MENKKNKKKSRPKHQCHMRPTHQLELLELLYTTPIFFLLTNIFTKCCSRLVTRGCIPQNFNQAHPILRNSNDDACP